MNTKLFISTVICSLIILLFYYYNYNKLTNNNNIFIIFVILGILSSLLNHGLDNNIMQFFDRVVIILGSLLAIYIILHKINIYNIYCLIFIAIGGLLYYNSKNYNENGVYLHILAHIICTFVILYILCDKIYIN